MKVTFNNLSLILILLCINHCSMKAMQSRSELHDAARKNQVTLLAQLLQNQGVNEKDKLGNTPLHYAAKNGHRKAVALLLCNNADITIKNSSGLTPYEWAIDNGHVIEELLLKKSNKPTQDKILTTDSVEEQVKRLYTAITEHNFSFVLHYLDEGNDANVKDEEGTPILHTAVCVDDERIVELLLSRGALAHSIDDSSSTPVHKVKSAAVLRLLIENGASVHSSDHLGRRPLHTAVDKGNEEVIGLLLGHCADPMISDVLGETAYYKAKIKGLIMVNPLPAAVKAQLFHLIKRALDSGSSPNTRDEEGNTLLHSAAENGYYEIAQLLIDKGADVNACDTLNRTPLHQASYNEHIKVMALLIQRGARVNQVNKQGDTPLHYMLSNILVEPASVKLLIEKGADLKIKNLSKRTPRQHAVFLEREQDIISLL